MKLIGLPLSFFLGACSVAPINTLGGITLADAQTAAAIDPSGASCYNALGDIGQAQAVATGKTGILTLIATKRAVTAVLSNPACASIELGIFAELLKATPIAPLVP